MATQRITYLLDYLIPTLSPQEVRELRSRLHQVDFRVDILTTVPVDLRILICLALEGTDIWPCLAVSKKWRAILLSELIRKQLSKKWFPGLLETASLKGISAEDLFVRAARNSTIRATGKFRSILNHELFLAEEKYFKLDPSLHSMPSQASPFPILSENPESSSKPRCTRQFHYSTGRVAWQYQQADSLNPLIVVDTLIIVDDFRTRLRKVLRLPHLLLRSTEKCQLSALGDRLVVARKGRELFAWKLETAMLERVQFPETNMRDIQTTTQGHTFAFMKYRNFSIYPPRFYVWKFGGALLELPLEGPWEQNEKHNPDIPLAHGHKRAEHGIFIHPHREEVVYVVSLIRQVAYLSITRTVIIVHRFEDCRYCESISYNLTPHLASLIPEILLCVKPRKRSSYGQYHLASFGPSNDLWQARGKDSKRGEDSKRAEISESIDPSDSPTVDCRPELTVSFNVYTGEFAVDCYHLWNRLQAPLCKLGLGHVWNNQMTVCCYKQGKRWSFLVDDRGELIHPVRFLLTINSSARYDPCPGQNADFSVYTSSSSPNESVERRRQLQGPDGVSTELAKCNPAYALLDDGRDCRETDISVLHHKRGVQLPPEAVGGGVPFVAGDDDFLFFFNTQGYSAWAFHDDLLSSRDAGSMENNAST